MTTITYEAPDSRAARQFLAALAAERAMDSQRPASERRVYLDSFDWRLHGMGAVLVLAGATLRLERAAGDPARAVAPATAAIPPRWTEDLPPGRLRDLVATRLPPRALIPLVVLTRHWQVHRLRDRTGRVQVRIVEAALTIDRPGRSRVRRTFTVTGLGRHPRIAAVVARLAHAAGLAPSLQPALAWALDAVGLAPGVYSAKMDVVLREEMTAREAVQAIGRRLLQTIRQNEAGVAANVDSEFLHDFRVAVRRTRALLGQCRGTLPARATAEMSAAFRELGQLTGPARDHDVYLLAQDEIRGRVPPLLRPGLDALFERLRERRAAEYVAIAAVIRGADYKRRLRRWAALLDPPAGRRLAASPAADLPARQLAAERITRRWRKVLARGQAIDESTAPESLHRLRIDCKKLRYLLEFFASLYPAEDVARLTKQLKTLQDNLGDHNDLVVQQAWLREELSRDLPLDEAAALEALLDTLARRQREVRRKFAATFAGFASEEVAASFTRLFGARA